MQYIERPMEAKRGLALSFIQAKHSSSKIFSNRDVNKKGYRHDLERIPKTETTKSERCLRSCVCKRKTYFKCLGCSSPGDPLSICFPPAGRDCWNRYHVQREYNLPSRQSHDEKGNYKLTTLKPSNRDFVRNDYLQTFDVKISLFIIPIV